VSCASARASSVSRKWYGTTIMVNKVLDWYGRRTLARKLMASVLTTSAVSLVVACAVFAIYDYTTSRTRLVRDVTTLADVVGANSTAALAFRDVQAATETLRAMAFDRHIVSARLLTNDGAPLGTYTRDPKDTVTLRNPQAGSAPGVSFDGGRIRVIRAVWLDHTIVG